MIQLPLVELRSGTIFVGDLHLDLGERQAVDAFVDWLAAIDPQWTPKLVILGDLFEYWLGPAHARSVGGRRVLAAMRERSEAGLEIDVLHGNRDFLLDAKFEAASGARVRPFGFVGEVDGARVLVLHGDELCTLDHAYQRLRRVIRSRPVRLFAALLPRFLGRMLAKRLRKTSRRAVDAKPAAEKAQQESACRELCAEVDAAAIVTGHVHRARDEQLADGPRWLVVDAFGGERDALRVTDGGAGIGALELGSSGARDFPVAVYATA